MISADDFKLVTDKCVKAIAAFGGDVTQEDIDDVLRLCLRKNKGIIAEQEDLEAMRNDIESRVCFQMPFSCEIIETPYEPWIHTIPEEAFLHWDCYYEYLLTKPHPMHKKDVDSIDVISHKIVDRLENPCKPGKWERRGLVVGQVQSGKTANYLAVVSKAADCGYKFIVILAGTLNHLRQQTQGRVDEGFIGRNTEKRHKNDPVGVALTDSWEKAKDKAPIYLTTWNSDFSKKSAETVGLSIGASVNPIVLVIKKNATSLRNLIEWISSLNSKDELSKLPFLLIDDEADYAGVNVKKDDEQPARINSQIRDLLHLFGRACYLGYTATPFANIFISPELNDPDHGEDLFPRDFIVNLEPSPKYIGPEQYFNGNNRLLVPITDNEDSSGEGPLPVRHPKDFELEELPPSMVDALYAFVVAKAIRLARGHVGQNFSMIVNASRFKDMHEDLKVKLQDEVDIIKHAVDVNAGLPTGEALENPTIKRLHDVFVREYEDNDTMTEWEDVQPLLPDSALPIELVKVNSDKTAGDLDYSTANYPKGRTLVVVGGMSLSRGLTLEGLTVSYYLRNTVMYDSMMQMGRWFGYRPGYADLCRVYMTELSIGWYQFVTRALHELRQEFDRMAELRLTPSEYGLRVLDHPETLIVTAQNKMRHSASVNGTVNYDGKLKESAFLSGDPKDHAFNRQHLNDFVAKMEARTHGSEEDARPAAGYLWRDIPFNWVHDYIKGFKSHALEQVVQTAPALEYIRKLGECGVKKWDVVLVSLREPNKDPDTGFPLTYDLPQPKITVNTMKRRIGSEKRQSVVGETTLLTVTDNRRVGSTEQEGAGLSKFIDDASLKALKESYRQQTGKQNLSGSFYRDLRQRYGANPLLLLYVIDGTDGTNVTKEKDGPIVYRGLVAYGISMPSYNDNLRSHTAQYVVNSIWLKNRLEELQKEQDEEGEDD